MNGWDHDVKGTDDTWETAHQMRSTLAIIKGRVQLMQQWQARGGVAAPPSAGEFAAIDEAIGRLVRLIERIED